MATRLYWLLVVRTANMVSTGRNDQRCGLLMLKNAEEHFSLSIMNFMPRDANRRLIRILTWADQLLRKDKVKICMLF
jgi:hypothetical protein